MKDTVNSIPYVVVYGVIMPDVHRVGTQLVKSALGYGVGVEDLGQSWLGVVRGLRVGSKCKHCQWGLVGEVSTGI